MKNNLYLLIGDNLNNINFYKNDILKKIKVSTDEIIPYDLSSESISNVLDEASMPSLFSKTKVIVGTDFDISKMTNDDTTYLKNYLANPGKDIYIILIAKKADARLAAYKIFKEYFTIIDTLSDSESDIYTYTKNLIKDKKYQISDYNLKYLLSKTGNNVDNITNELTKLFIYKENDKTINTEDIDALIIDNIDNVMYEFTNAILDNDLNTISKMYNNFKLENISFDYLIASIANTFRQALIIKLLLNDNTPQTEIAKTIGRQAYFVKKMAERLYNYTDRDLTRYITKLATIDANFKSGKTAIDELELFLIDKEH